MAHFVTDYKFDTQVDSGNFYSCWWMVLGTFTRSRGSVKSCGRYEVPRRQYGSPQSTSGRRFYDQLPVPALLRHSADKNSDGRYRFFALLIGYYALRSYPSPTPRWATIVRECGSWLSCLNYDGMGTACKYATRWRHYVVNVDVKREVIGIPVTSVYSVSYIHHVPKNETRIILNILYSCESVALKFSMWYPDGLSY